MTTLAITDDAHWRELRSQHVGGSEVAVLFGEHPQITKFDLWNRKAGKLPEPDLSDNDRVFWGSVLEPAIAEGVRQKTGWTIRKVRRYHSMLPDLALGGTLDYEIVSHERGPGVLEIKTADWLVARGWEDSEPPISYMLQVQAYLACTGRGWGCMAVLVGGNDLRLFEYERRNATISIIRNAVVDFWQSIRENRPPAPDYSKDGATIARLYSAVQSGKVADLSDSNRLRELIDSYQAGSASEKDGKALKETAKAEILTLIGEAERTICGDYTISAKMIPGTHLEFDRRAYRDFRINQKGVKAA